MIIYLILSIAIAILILFLCIRHGFRIGFAREVSAMFSLAAGGLVISLLASLLGKVQTRNITGVIAGIALLALFGFLYRILHVLFNSINVIAKIPVISWLDSALGVVSGFICGFIILYVLEYVMRNFILK